MMIETKPLVILAPGIIKLNAVAEQYVRWCFSDCDEIGTSDVSCCILDILESLKIDKDAVTDFEWTLLRNLVMNKISELEGN